LGTGGVVVAPDGWAVAPPDGIELPADLPDGVHLTARQSSITSPRAWAARSMAVLCITSSCERLETPT
jgi:hypothetical protein